MLYGCGGCVVHASSASLLTEAFCTPPPPSPAPPYSLLLPLQFAVGQVDLHSALKHHRTSFSDPSEFTIVFTGKCYYFPLYCRSFHPTWCCVSELCLHVCLEWCMFYVWACVCIHTYTQQCSSTKSPRCYNAIIMSFLPPPSRQCVTFSVTTAGNHLPGYPSRAQWWWST